MNEGLVALYCDFVAPVRSFGGIMVKIEMFQNSRDAEPAALGQVLFREGDPGDVMYVLVDAEVTLSIAGREIERLDAGSVFGEMALIDAAPRSATATVSKAGHLVRIDARRFQFLVGQTPHFALQVMRVMTERLRRMNERIKGL